MYTPRQFPITPDQLPDYVQQELQNVARAFVDPVNFVQLNVTTVAPAKPRRGQCYFADGTSWNPGSGEGVYCFYNNTWNKLG